MPRAINRATLMGYVGRDPEIRMTQGGGKVATLNVATSDAWKDKATGQMREHTEWHRVVCFNDGITDIIDKYVRKGSRLYIEGVLRTRKWEDRDGGVRYTTEIQIIRYGCQLILVSGKGEQEAYGRAERPDDRVAGPGNEPLDQDIPF